MFTTITIGTVIFVLAFSYLIMDIWTRKGTKKNKYIPRINKQEINERGLVPTYLVEDKILHFGNRMVQKVSLNQLKLLDTFAVKEKPQASLMDDRGMNYIVGVGDIIGKYGSKVVNIKKGRMYIETEYTDKKGNTYIHRAVKKITDGMEDYDKYNEINLEVPHL